MTVPRTPHLLTIILVSWLAAGAGLAGQETFSRAKDLYILAAYDEALVLLDRLHQSAPADEATEIAGYQVFCLLALGRTDDAQKAIVALVKANPLYRPSEAIASPRTRAVFDDVRKGLLPGIVQETYDRAKAAFDRNEPQVAVTEFDRVLALLDEPELSALPRMADFRRLAAGFRDLSKAAAATATAAASAAAKPAAPVSTTSAPPAPALPAIYTADDANVVPPVALSRSTPAWIPRNQMDARRQFRGVLEVIVDEKGDVISAALGKSVHPEYDAALLRMARTWKFRPATREGVPVRYRSTLEIRLDPSRVGAARPPDSLDPPK
jgi:TonB family protein